MEKETLKEKKRYASPRIDVVKVDTESVLAGFSKVVDENGDEIIDLIDGDPTDTDPWLTRRESSNARRHSSVWDGWD